MSRIGMLLFGRSVSCFGHSLFHARYAETAGGILLIDSADGFYASPAMRRRITHARRGQVAAKTVWRVPRPLWGVLPKASPGYERGTRAGALFTIVFSLRPRSRALSLSSSRAAFTVAATGLRGFHVCQLSRPPPSDSGGERAAQTEGVGVDAV